jgi:hypothetical protein
MFFGAPRTKASLEKRIVIYPLKEERKSRVLPAGPPPPHTHTHRATPLATLLNTCPFAMLYNDNYILQ